MTISEWQQLSPEAAAREVHARVRSRLSAAQQRAVVAWLPDIHTLTDDFATARRGPSNPLGGVPFFAKDLFDVPGAPTFAGSTFLPEARLTPQVASALLRAARTAGLVCAGKTHLHEFAYGITGENPHYGDCDNPRFPGRTTGGSSSGSAAIVAADIAPIAFGTDTGGSIRVPAAFCGLYGFRLSPCDAWVRDAFPLSPTFDTAGWFTRTAADMRVLLTALAGFSSTVRTLRGCYIDLPGVDADVSQTCLEAASPFAPPADKTTIEDLRQGFAPTLSAYNTLVTRDAWQVHQSWAEKYRDRYDPVVWQRLNRVHALTADDIAAAERTRKAVQLLWTKFFLAYDFLVLPATPCGALTKAECTAENRTRLLSLTAPASVGGLPVLTVPVALPSGLTTGLQVIVNHALSPVLALVLGAMKE